MKKYLQNKICVISVMILLVVLPTIAFIVLLNNQQKIKSNEINLQPFYENSIEIIPPQKIKKALRQQIRKHFLNNDNLFYQPEIDDKKYKFLTLQNNLQVVLISDDQTDYSAASLSVSVGSIHNPQNMPGLAHFLEHMLFRGSKKYPQVDTFVDKIKKSNGQFNAYTAQEETNYYFQSSNNVFEDILDVWSRFFIDPLLDQNSQDKEVHAVQSEFDISIANHNYLISYLKKFQLANKKSGYSKFTCGNINSLVNQPKINNINIYDEMVFFK